jgi:hypothetical protein
MTYIVKKGNKYNAKKIDYNGQRFDSKGEAGYCEQLDWRIKAGEIQGYERQVKIPLKVNGVLICNYYADFMVTDKHGAKEAHEYKGFMTNDFQLKWRILQAIKDELFPEGIELIIIQHQSFYRKKSFKK